jgi:hypothetical protein
MSGSHHAGRFGRRALALGVALAIGVASQRARATMVEPMETAAQAASADRVFVGTVTAVASRPRATTRNYFETVITFAVEDVVAGDLPSSIELVFSGGSVGGIRQRIDGMPEPAVGERYVVLLETDREPRLASPIVGFNQGLYRVVGTSRSSAVVRDRNGHPLSAATAAAPHADGEPTLDDFLDTLRAARM